MNFKTFMFALWTTGDIIFDIFTQLDMSITVSNEAIAELLPIEEVHSWYLGEHKLDEYFSRQYDIFGEWHKTQSQES
jgi:hypothetical protein